MNVLLTSCGLETKTIEQVFLKMLKCALDVHCSKDTCNKAGQYSMSRRERIRLGNEQAIVFEEEYFSIIE